MAIALFAVCCSLSPALMWAVDLGTCAILMDSKPHKFPPPFPTHESSSDQQHDSDHQLQSSDNNTNSSSNADERRPKKRTRRVVDASTTCAPEQLHCRYANKKCLNPRAVKRTGGLHTFCAMHRANANRNQRRLDMRKRMARQALRAQAEAAQQPPTPNATPKAGEATVAVTSPAGLFDPRYEPLQIPLVTLFLPPVTTTFGYQLDAPTTPSTPHDWSSSTSTDGTSPPPPPPGGMRF
jgi:hypothetical protein